MKQLGRSRGDEQGVFISKVANLSFPTQDGRSIGLCKPFTEVVQCPTCSDSWVHLGPVALTQQADTIEIGYGPTVSHEFNPKINGRGSCVTIRFIGECGHQAHLVFQFHKSETFVWWAEAEGEVRELWRD